IPAGAVDMPRFEITLNRNPLNQPMVVDPALISDASDKLVHNEGPWARPVPGQLLEFAIFNEMGFYSEPLAKRGLMTMRYRDDDADGNVDGSDPPVRVDTLNAWTLDEENRMWAALPTAGLDRTAGTLSVYFGTPGVYALIGQLDTSVGNVFAYPVPFRPNGPNAGAGIGQTGTEADGITFNSVPQSGRVEIYTLDGRLVRKLDIPSGLVVPKLQWDVRTASGQKAASGVYIWRVVSSAGSAKTGKLMVIW
ncbi:MAG TPA: T9SS type A sorting domain-containing protein, partial [Elusimicrobiales bacterium]|nr:T9SS type A sorting domain-containing protein [Elusimicrobiales bacterium]